MNGMRFTLQEARDALQVAVDLNYAGEVMTCDHLLQCTEVIESIGKCLIDDDEDEAKAQRARDKCIGAHGYDVDRLK